MIGVNIKGNKSYSGLKDIRYDKFDNNPIGYKINSQRIYQSFFNIAPFLISIHSTQNLYFLSTDSQQRNFFLKSIFF